MKPLTGEWVEKAEGDYRTALREKSALELANWDAVCFHSQQCAEKYLKALLTEYDIAFPRTHDLGLLLNLALPAESQLGLLRRHLYSLTDSAVEIRYPGMSADAEDAEQAFAAAVQLRAMIRSHLRLG